MTPAERLEATQHDLFWIPDDAVVLERGGLLALSCPRVIPHLNIGLRARLPEHELRGAVAQARARFAPGAGRWFVPDTVDPRPLVGALEANGFVPGHDYEARVLRPEAGSDDAGSGVTVRRVEDLAGFRDFTDVVAAAFGMPVQYSDEELHAQLGMSTGPAARSRRYVGYVDGRPVCAGGLNVYPHLSMGFLWAGATAPDVQGRGHYTALLAARLRAARELGLEWTGVYARVDTSAPIVAKHGFERVGAMTYWATDDATLPP